MAPRPCLDCGALTTGTRCRDCDNTRERARPTRPTSATRTPTERDRRAATVAAWRATHGDLCPGWQRAPHPVTPPNILTADHVTAVGAGGPQTGELVVLCRSCNGRKDARTRRDDPTTDPQHWRDYPRTTSTATDDTLARWLDTGTP